MYTKVSERNIGWELDISSNGLRDKRRGQREGLVNVTLTDERDDMSACQLRGKRATRAVYRAKAPRGQAEGRKHSNSISELIGQTQPIPSMHRPRFSSGFCCSVWPLEMGLPSGIWHLGMGGRGAGRISLQAGKGIGEISEQIQQMRTKV